MRTLLTTRAGRLLATATAAVGLSLALAVPAHADPATGTISGTFTTSAVSPADVAVMAGNEAKEFFRVAELDEAGHYTLPDLPAGEYRVQFVYDGPGVTGWSQWATGARDEESAALLTVRPGETTIVDDAAFPTGSLSVTLRSYWTGEVVEAFCASMSSGRILAEGCTDTGTVLVSGLPEGEYSVLAEPTEQEPRLPQFGDATVIAGRTVELDITD